MSRKVRDQEQPPSVANGQLMPGTLPISERTPPLNKRPQSITPQSIKAHALDTFGSAEKAEHWMTRPNPLFDGKTPIEVMQSDPIGVEAALVRIDYGVYV